MSFLPNSVSIRFTGNGDEEERGLRIVIFGGPVEYTEYIGVIRIPRSMLERLSATGITYEIIADESKIPKYPPFLVVRKEAESGT